MNLENLQNNPSSPTRRSGTLSLNKVNLANDVSMPTSEAQDLTNFDVLRDQLEVSIANQDIKRTAYLLAITFDGIQMGGESEKMVLAIMKLPFLKPYHETIWSEIKPLITPEYQRDVYLLLTDSCDWDI
jgi:hypothetical protein